MPVAGPGQVLVKVHASGMCYTDVWATQGYGGDIYPQTPGHEVVGEIVDVGAGVQARRVGDRIGTTWVQSACGRCPYCREHRPLSGQTAVNCDAPRTTGFASQGGYAEYIAVAAEGTVLLPDELAYVDAAPMMCAGYTTWSGLRDAAPQPHEKVAVLGIGGLGHVALQLSRACGFETIAITHSADKRDLAIGLGADRVVANGAELRDLGGADVLLVTTNEFSTAEEAMTGVRVDGRVILCTRLQQAVLDRVAAQAVPHDAPAGHRLHAWRLALPERGAGPRRQRQGQADRRDVLAGPGDRRL